MKTRFIFSAAAILIAMVFAMNGCNSSSNSDNNGSDNIEVPNQNHIGWAVGSNVNGYGTIIRTIDSGKTWKREGNITTIPDITINDVAAVDRLNVWAVGAGSPGTDDTYYGTILHLSDAGENWERQGTSESIPDVSFLGISAINNQTAWTAGSKGVIMHTDDGGNHWHQQAEGHFPDVIFEMVSAVDKDNVWAVGGEVKTVGEAVTTVPFIARTTDGGENWELIHEDIFEDNTSGGLIDVHAVTADIVWVVGGFGKIAITVNGGDTWVRSDGHVGLLDVNGVCALDEKRAWIAIDSSIVLYTSDGGLTWTQQHQVSSAPGISSIVYMGITAIDEHNAWLVGSYPQEDKAIILYTVDGGERWTEQSSPANSLLRRVSFVGDVK